MSISPLVLGVVLGLLSVGVVAFVLGLRVGARARGSAPLSEDQQVAAALNVLRRHLEMRALADLEASGAPIWSPDARRVAELSFGLQRDRSASVGLNVKAGRRSADRD